MSRLLPYIVAFGIGTAVGMMHSHDTDYKIIRADKTYLLKKSTGQKQPITDDFQLGDLEYRINGLKRGINEKGI